MTVLAGSGSGECLERAEYVSLLELIASEKFDAVLSEDLGRIARRIHAHLVCEHCVDHDTRLISLNDHVDTAQDGWEDHSIFAAWHHERSNRDTSKRIKRTHSTRFQQGGCLPLPIFGYRKKPGAKTDDDLEKVPEAIPIFKEWFERLDRGELYAEIADWLNGIGQPTGPYCSNQKWDCAMVARVSHNWILKGARFRNKRKTKRTNSSGKYKSRKADPGDLAIRHVPSLAFFDEIYYDRVIAKADARNAKYCRAGKNGSDPLQNRPKKRTRFPGQSIFCGVCGRLFVFGGHGQTDHLMCTGAREHVCWNGITVNGPVAAEKISAAVFAEIEALAEFDATFLELVNEDAQRLDQAREGRLHEIVAEITRTDQEIGNVMKFIRGGDDSPRIRMELQQLEEKLRQLQYEKDHLARGSTDTVVVPPVTTVRQIARAAFKDLAIGSFEFAKLLRGLTGKIFVFPYRLCDGGHIVLRAKFQLQIANLLPDQRLQEILAKPLERSLTVDLSEKPPQRVEYRQQVMAGRGEGENEDQVARALGITKTAAQRAAALDRLMKRLGFTDPYVRLQEPPTDYSKLRRHLHPRYHFEPLPGHNPG